MFKITKKNKLDQDINVCVTTGDEPGEMSETTEHAGIVFVNTGSDLKKIFKGIIAAQENTTIVVNCSTDALTRRAEKQLKGI